MHKYNKIRFSTEPTIILDARHLENSRGGLVTFILGTFGRIVQNNIEKGRNIKVLVNTKVGQNNNELVVSFLNEFRDYLIYLDVKPWSLKNIIWPLYIPITNMVIFSPHFDAPLLSKGKVIVVIHDIMPIRLKKYWPKANRVKKIAFTIYCFWHHVVLKRLVYVPTQATKNDLEQYFCFPRGGEVIVCSEGFNSFKSRGSQTNNILDQISAEKFILYVGDCRPHKNVPMMLKLAEQIYANSKQEIKLIMVGDNSRRDPKIPILNELPYVKHLGFIDDAELHHLRRASIASILISSYEGFGLPAVECGAYGKPLIAYDIPALKEISPAWTFFIKDLQDINKNVANIQDYLKNFEKPNDFEVSEYTKRFSWKSVAKTISKAL